MVPSELRRVASRIATVATALFALSIAGCGGGGGGSTAVPAASKGSNTLSLSVTIPNTLNVASANRTTKSVPSNSASIAVFAYPQSGTQPATPTYVGDVALPATAPNVSLCSASGSNRICNITFAAPVGADVISIEIYDQEPVGGAIPSASNLLAAAAATTTVNANGGNSVSLTLVGTAGSFTAGTALALPPFALTSGGSSGVSGGSLSFTVPGNALSSGSVQVAVGQVSASLLIPLAGQRTPQFTAGAGNTLIYAFNLQLVPPSTTLAASLSLTGTTFTINSSLSSSLGSAGTLKVAVLSSGTYNDVGTLSYTVSGSTLAITGGTSGIVQSGIFIIYLPPASSGTVGSSSTSATGALAILTIAGTTYAYVPTTTGLMQVALTNGSSLASGGSTTQPVGGARVDACAADATHNLVYCVPFGGTSIYVYNVSSGTVASPTTISTDAGTTVTFSGGTCTICGIVYDSVGNDVIISTGYGYEVYSAVGTQVAKIQARIAENFGFNSSTRTILSPQYGQGGGNTIDLINLSTLGWYTLASQPGGISDPDHGAIDTSTNVGITANEFSSGSSENVYIVNLNGVTFPSATSGVATPISGLTASTQTLTSSVFSTCSTTADGIAVDSSAHLAFMASEYCPGYSGFGVLPLTGASTSYSYVFATMPSGPAGSFIDNQDPHALTVFNLPGVCADCALVSNLNKTELGIIDLNQLLAATRSGGDPHTVDSSVNLTSSSSGNPIVTYLTTGLYATSSARAPASTQQNVRR